MVPTGHDSPETTPADLRALGTAVDLAVGATGAMSRETERDLGQQAGIVTAANAAVRRAGSPARTPALPGVLADVPVAVLVIDQRTSAVTYANIAAVELAGNVRLPIDVDTWGAAAGLTDLSGEPLASSSGPLSTVAQGRPVTGEAVRLVAGRAAPSQRAPTPTRATTTSCSGSPGSRCRRRAATSSWRWSSSCKLDPLEEAGDPDAYLQALRERAVIATDITFTITDPRQPDNPLVWVNPSFTRVTGYEAEEVVGPQLPLPAGPGDRPGRRRRDPRRARASGAR